MAQPDVVVLWRKKGQQGTRILDRMRPHVEPRRNRSRRGHGAQRSCGPGRDQSCPGTASPICDCFHKLLVRSASHSPDTPERLCASAYAAWRPRPLRHAASSGPPTAFAARPGAPAGFSVHGVEQDHGRDSCDHQRPEGREAEQHGRRGQQANVEAAEQVGHQTRRERPSLAGDHGCAEVHAFRLGPADRRQQSRRRRRDRPSGMPRAPYGRRLRRRNRGRPHWWSPRPRCPPRFAGTAIEASLMRARREGQAAGQSTGTRQHPEPAEQRDGCAEKGECRKDRGERTHTERVGGVREQRSSRPARARAAGTATAAAIPAR